MNSVTEEDMFELIIKSQARFYLILMRYMQEAVKLPEGILNGDIGFGCDLWFRQTVTAFIFIIYK